MKKKELKEFIKEKSSDFLNFQKGQHILDGTYIKGFYVEVSDIVDIVTKLDTFTGKVKFGDKTYHKFKDKCYKKRKKFAKDLGKESTFKKLDFYKIGFADGFADGFKFGEKSKFFCKRCGVFLYDGLDFCDTCEKKIMKEIFEEFGD